MNKVCIPINVAVVGLGGIAQEHLGIWRRIGEVRVVAVCDSNEFRAREVAKVQKIPAYYTDLGEMLRNEQVLITDICTPPQVHSPLIIQALQSGCHVLVEKPLCMTTNEAKQIISAHESSKAKLSVVHNGLFSRVMRKVLSLIKEGDLGEIISTDIRVVAPATDPMLSNKGHWCHSLPGGRFGEVLAHPIYMVRAILGDVQLKSVHSTKVGTSPWVPFDELWVDVKTRSSYGSLYCSFNSVQEGWFVDIYGTRGIIKSNLLIQAAVRLGQRPVTPFGIGVEGLGQIYQLFVQMGQNVVTRLCGMWQTGHDICLRAFVDSVLNDKAPLVSVEEAYATVELLEQICEKLDRTGVHTSDEV